MLEVEIRREPASVIANREADSSVFASDLRRDLRRVSVTDGVGNGFLQNPEDREHPLGRRFDRFVRLDDDPDAERPRKTIRKPRQCGRDTKFQPRGGQFVAHRPKLPDGGLRRFLDEIQMPTPFLFGAGHPVKTHLLDHRRDVLQRAVVQFPSDAAFLVLLHPDDIRHVPVPQVVPLDGRSRQTVQRMPDPPDLENRLRIIGSRKIPPQAQSGNLRIHISKRDNEPSPEGPDREKARERHQDDQDRPEVPDPDERPEQLVPRDGRHDIPRPLVNGIDRDRISFPLLVPDLDGLSERQFGSPQRRQIPHAGRRHQNLAVRREDGDPSGKRRPPGKNPEAMHIGRKIRTGVPTDPGRHVFRQVFHVGACDELDRPLVMHEAEPRDEKHGEHGQQNGKRQDDKEMSPHSSSSSSVTTPYFSARSRASVLLRAPSLS